MSIKLNGTVVLKAALIGIVVMFIGVLVSSILAKLLAPMDVEFLCCLGGLILVTVPGMLYPALADPEISFLEGALGGALSGAIAYGVGGLLAIIAGSLIDVLGNTGGILTLDALVKTITSAGFGAVFGAIGGLVLAFIKRSGKVR